MNIKPDTNDYAPCVVLEWLWEPSILLAASLFSKTLGQSESKALPASPKKTDR